MKMTVILLQRGTGRNVAARAGARIYLRCAHLGRRLFHVGSGVSATCACGVRYATTHTTHITCSRTCRGAARLASVTCRGTRRRWTAFYLDATTRYDAWRTAGFIAAVLRGLANGSVVALEAGCASFLVPFVILKCVFLACISPPCRLVCFSVRWDAGARLWRRQAGIFRWDGRASAWLPRPVG